MAARKTWAPRELLKLRKEFLNHCSLRRRKVISSLQHQLTEKTEEPKVKIVLNQTKDRSVCNGKCIGNGLGNNHVDQSCNVSNISPKIKTVIFIHNFAKHLMLFAYFRRAFCDYLPTPPSPRLIEKNPAHYPRKKPLNSWLFF